MTIERRDGHLAIQTTPVHSAEEATATAAEAAQGDDLVAVVPDQRVAARGLARIRTSATSANDTDRSQQWALDRAGFEASWADSDGSGVKVAVIDTGVQSSHPDLAGQVLPGYRFWHAGSVPNSAPMNPAFDDQGHGTHVAGIVSAIANNAQGIAGGAPGACILPVKVLDSTGSGWDSDVARGIDWAVVNGAKVINLSLGGSSPGASGVAVDDAVASDVLVFAAAGNGGAGGAPEYPGANPNAIAVASVTSALTRSSFSTTGSYVDIAAPGSGIWSTYPTSTYASLSGTSMATPYAAATGALIRARFPSWTVAQARQRLLGTADDLGPTGPDVEYGYGFIDPFEATR
ncbi:MAG TPA: S8 family serine peptidase [Acidimicrobiia bacterium]|nr:S8 family serine peptidase [Acidimicrobiia bacterium]